MTTRPTYRFLAKEKIVAGEQTFTGSRETYRTKTLPYLCLLYASVALGSRTHVFDAAVTLIVQCA